MNFYRATFLEPVEDRDADGQIIQRYDERFHDRVSLRFLRGGENVMEARMQSRNPVIIGMRDSARARRVTSEWRVRIDGRLYDVREEPRPTEDRRNLEMLAEAGMVR
ncbi:phage head closure protein [Falsirhodobacter halotolerans]|uniref:phage head closure protein n=1 Tax=Falsirhodobacter halotolerans TaxID=1146892 RepID=UPI001FD028C2|nr:phage head closure protein [Falsirhodobacter halotolerans]MCJ8138602.1 phage head closure protein [Falsirhodobacter halotolerans]